MTSEEISKAKQEAEKRIREELQQLQKRTGMRLDGVFVDLVLAGFPLRDSVVDVADVRIELRVP